MDDWLIFNGVDAATGGYLDRPMTAARFAARILALEGDCGPWQRVPLPEIDPDDLASAGWGIVFPHDADPAIRRALEPLLTLRRGEACARDGDRFAELTYFSGESKYRFLMRHQVGPGPVDPSQIPYYLLLVGGPCAISFTFQAALGVQFAVGRLDLETPADYARYAESVCALASSSPRPTSEGDLRTAFFAPNNADDRATGLSSAYLVEPLMTRLGTLPGVAVEGHLAADGSRARLRHLLNGGRPDVLFTASHGLGVDLGAPDLAGAHQAAEDPSQARVAHQRSVQGAILCQDWPGPRATDGPIASEHYLAAGDIDPASDLRGLIAFLFACYSAGTPTRDSFPRPEQEAAMIAPQPFSSSLARRLLSCRGAAQAVIGHVDRAWGCSFLWGGAGSQVQAFYGMLERLLRRHRIGWALECFAARHGELAVDLVEALERARAGESVDARELSRLWTATRDAAGWILHGDPAVRACAQAPPRSERSA